MDDEGGDAGDGHAQVGKLERADARRAFVDRGAEVEHVVTQVGRGVRNFFTQTNDLAVELRAEHGRLLAQRGGRGQSAVSELVQPRIK